MIEFVGTYCDQFGVEPICVVIGCPVPTYCEAKNRKDAPSDREVRDEELVPLICAVWKEKGKRLHGARKVWKQRRVTVWTSRGPRSSG
jgi:hypothetical protein